MVQEFIRSSMQLLSIGLVVIAAGIWTRSRVVMRPKHIDAQTLIGGTLWSQTIIPIGLMISKMLDESIDPFVEGFYLVSGVLLLCITGMVLIVHETRRIRRINQRRDQINSAMQNSTLVTLSTTNTESKGNLSQTSPSKLNFSVDSLSVSALRHNAAYYKIGIVCLLAGVIKLCEFIMFVILDNYSL